MNGYGCVQIEFYLQMQKVGQIWLEGFKFADYCFTCFKKYNLKFSHSFIIFRFFLADNFMLYLYNQGSVNSHSSNIQVRFKFYISKIFKILFTLNTFLIQKTVFTGDVFKWSTYASFHPLLGFLEILVN